MLAKLREVRYLDQETAVFELSQRFGERQVYVNRHGNPATSRSVLREFKRLTEDSVVWDQADQLWRFREGYDPAGERAVP